MGRPLSEKSAIASIRALMLDKKPNYDAIRSLLRHAGLKKKSVSFALRMTLDKWEKERKRLFIDQDTLGEALEFSGLIKLEPALAERVCKCAARAGYHGRFPDLPRDLLGRDMTGEEVALLIRSYTSRIATRDESTEKELTAWAKRYSGTDAERQIALIEQFVDDWNTTGDGFG